MEVAIDVGSNAATLTLPAWGLDAAPARRLAVGGDSLAVAADAAGDSVLVRGTVRGGTWIGEARRGTAVAPFELVPLHPLADTEWEAIVGTYATATGGLLGIGWFSELGTLPFMVDYTTGRIAPLLPIARDRLLVGHAVMSPVLPADTLSLDWEPARGLRSVTFREQDGAPVVADRLPTRDLDVQFANGPVTLAGTLTLPSGSPPYPALVLVHGSNALTRRVFGPWTRYFAGLGFAVLAYDKRGTGTSTGDWTEADFSVLAADVLAGVRLLATRDDIRPDRIGLWGASQAGWILPLVAAQAPREVAFMIVHAGTGTTVREQGMLYLEHELRLAGLPESSAAIGRRYQVLDDVVTRAGSGWDELERYYETHRSAEPWLWPPRPMDDWFRAYYRMLMDFDPSQSWERVTCPVLLLFGELDANVPPAASWPPIERALRRGGNTRVTHVVLPRANHLFLEAETGARDEYPGLSRFVPAYFDRMAAWLEAEMRAGGRPPQVP